MTEHPDLDTLSAYLDGDRAAEDHVRSCETCRAEVAALTAVRDRVAAPPAAPPPDARDRAVAAAVAAASGGPRRFPPRWAAAGAAGAVAAAVIGLLIVRPGHHATPTASKGNSAVGQALDSGNVINGGDLGDVSDADALRAKVEPVLHPASSGEGAAAGQTAGGSSGGDVGVRPPAAPPGTVRATANSRITGRCEGAALGLQRGPQVLLYAASARWQGTPAEVLAFAAGGTTTTAASRPSSVRVYVMAARGCRLLVFQSYAP